MQSLSRGLIIYEDDLTAFALKPSPYQAQNDLCHANLIMFYASFILYKSFGILNEILPIFVNERF